MYGLVFIFCNIEDVVKKSCDLIGILDKEWFDDYESSRGEKINGLFENKEKVCLRCC